MPPAVAGYYAVLAVLLLVRKLNWPHAIFQFNTFHLMFLSEILIIWSLIHRIISKIENIADSNQGLYYSLLPFWQVISVQFFQKFTVPNLGRLVSNFHLLT